MLLEMTWTSLRMENLQTEIESDDNYEASEIALDVIS